MRLRTCGVLGAALAALAALPATGEAAVTIGSNLNAMPDNNCGGSCTLTNLNLPGASTAPGGLTSPLNGVIVRWKLKSGSVGNPVALRVLRPVGGTTFTGAGTGPSQTTTGGGAVDQFTARLAIRSGDSVGVDALNDPLVLFGTQDALASALAWGPGGPLLADGATAGGNARGNTEVLVQAVIEPDADADGFGDETQDGCPGDAARQIPPCASGTPNPGANPPPPAGATDTTPPVVSSLAVTPRTFRIGRRTRISFRVSEIVRVRLAFAQLVPGRRQRGRCVRRARTGRRCTISVAKGSVLLRAQGRQSIAFDGRVGRALLRPGRYRITATARDLARNATLRSVSTSFRLLPRLRRAR